MAQNFILQKVGLLKESRLIRDVVVESGDWSFNPEASLITLQNEERNSFIKIHEEVGDKVVARITNDVTIWKDLIWEKL